MSMWTCKKCGQVYDDMFCGDYICDDCFDKMKREEKKQKQRNTPFFRVLSFALALSFMLCIFSGIGVASAEDIPTDLVSVVDGKYKGYDCISFSQNQVISSDYLKALYDGYKVAYPSINLMYVYLLGFDSSGVPHSYSPFGYGCRLLEFRYDANGDFRSTLYLDFVENANGDSYDYVYYGYNATSAYIHYKMNTSTTPEIYSYNFSFTDGSSGFDSLCSEQMYLVFVPFNTSATNYRTILPSLLAGTEDNLEVTPTYSLIDKPYIFSSMFPFEIDLSNAVDSGTGLVGVNYKNKENSGAYIEWFNDKRAINPYLTFDIHDNNFKHNYELIISYNSSIYNDSLFYLSDSYHQANNPFAQWCVDNDLEWFFGGISNIDATGVDTAQAYEIANRIASKNPQNYSFNTSFTLNTSAFDFSSSSGDTFRRVKINLNDYMTVLNTCLYRVQWRDKTNGQIIWTSYFATPDSYNKLTTPNGSLYYDYKYSDYSGDDLLQSLPSDSNKIDDDISSGNIPGNMIDTPTIDENGQTNWSDVDLGGMYSPLNFGLSAVSDFFQSLWVIFPVEIRTIIISGMSLIVVLRILGR